jgi:hypothetical protein
MVCTGFRSIGVSDMIFGTRGTFPVVYCVYIQWDNYHRSQR